MLLLPLLRFPQPIIAHMLMARRLLLDLTTLRVQNQPMTLNLISRELQRLPRDRGLLVVPVVTDMGPGVVLKVPMLTHVIANGTGKGNAAVDLVVGHHSGFD